MTTRAQLRECKQDKGSERELDNHMPTGNKEREVKVEVFRTEHPFIVLT